MKKNFLYTIAFSALFALASCGDDDSLSSGGETSGGGTSGGGSQTENLDPVQPTKSNSMNLYAHYMPWFSAPTASGVYNHWTRSSYALANDRSNLAAHYYPLIGAYASNDEAVLDYQCLLMKYSGLDGAILDWMGTSGKNDHGAIHEYTQKMVSALTKAGMKFAICYDEQTALSDWVFSDLNDAIEQGRTDMRYIKNTWLSKSNYAKNGSRPVVLCFGPARVQQPESWTYITAPLGSNTDFLVLNGFSSRTNDSGNQNSTGEFLWVNASPDYSNAKNFSLYVGGAMPGFYDAYETHYTTYDRKEGALFTSQLNAAKSAGLNWLQISTWNDYTEGTIIEPTEEFGYKYLTLLQQFAGVSYSQSELELVARWYKVCVAKGASNSDVIKAYKYLASLQTDKAKTLIESLEK